MLQRNLKKHTRRGDVVCHYGGDKFIVGMCEKSAEIGQKRAETIHEALAHLQIECEGALLPAGVIPSGTA